MEGFSFSFKRDELLRVLEDGGVSVPPSSKLSTEALEKRLKQTINSAQSLSVHVPKDGSFDPLALDPWPRDRPLLEAVRRGNLHEAQMAQDAMSRGENYAPLYQNAFMDVRQTLMGLGNMWDTGIKNAVVQDRDCETSAIHIKIVDLYKLDDSTPLILVLYSTATSHDPWPGIAWISSLPVRADGNGPELMNVFATHLEQKLLLKFLMQNERYLSKELAEKVERRDSEKDFKASFLLPVRPLGPEELGKLNLEFGCAVCGEKAGHRCSRCQSAWYCSPKCQKSDWSTHKHACRPLEKGTWLTVPFSTSHPDLAHNPNAVSTLISSRSSDPQQSLRDMRRAGEDTPPPNMHGTNPFLIKIQVPVANFGRVELGGTMLVYDRQKSIIGHISARTCPAEYERIKRECMTKGKMGGLKMYRWAKRAGPLQLSVCLDREPDEEVRW